MKTAVLLMTIFGLFACNQPTASEKLLQHRIDSLENRLADSYKPGFGEFMSNIQVHHAKLWFAGQHSNWKLADFEIHEIMETMEDIQKFQAERKESKLIGMIKPALDSVASAVKQQHASLFRRSYIELTNTCNNCHRAVNFDFNIVKIPDTQLFSNQDFSVHEPK